MSDSPSFDFGAGSSIHVAMIRYLPLILSLFFASPAAAATSAWQEIAPGAQLRLVSADEVDAEGALLIALEVRLDPGLKTYWRVPGETGIPLQLDFSASTGISDPRIYWPLPTRELTGGYTDHVYYGEVTFPVQLTVTNDNPLISIDIIMGVCSEICVPVSSHAEIQPQTGHRDIASDIAIRQAMANVPIDWSEGEPPLGTAAYNDESDLLVVAGVSEELDLSALIASMADASIIFAAPQKSPKPGVISFERLGWGEMSDLAGEWVSLVFQTPSGPFRVERQLVGIDQLPASE